MTHPLLEVEHLGYRYGDADAAAPPALDDISFRVDHGDFVAIVGPSGSGKTTLLRCIAGLGHPTWGEIRLGGHPVTDVPKELAIVFQDYSRSLFPWMRVRDNVDLPLRHMGLPAEERRQRIETALAEVGLSKAMDLFPWQLSGGMQQRVAIARAVAYRPEILLMDEPFASVDAQTRADLQDMAMAVWKAHDSTVLFVTHDIDESVYVANRVIVLSAPPTTVAAEVPVPLPRPRDQIDTKASPEFVALRAEVARLIRRRKADAVGGTSPAETAAITDDR
ncbi:MAG TPA: ABC transporter ATP-binding protein [Candidatus Limnocylindria bacterium]|nr:ABC transporter ATP-binding protein [Candidatus Limnocylindria bacterium]